MKHGIEFNFKTKDIHGMIPDTKLLGTRLMHTGNKKIYEIQDFVWNGVTDEWGFLCAHGETEPEVWRPLAHLYSVRESGEKRYVWL